MKPKAIIWTRHAYTDERIRQLLVDNNICPVLDIDDAVDIWVGLGHPYTLKEIWYKPLLPINNYKDEPFSVEQKSDEWIKEQVRLYPNIVMGESSTEHIERLVKCGVKNITFTSYGWHLFRIFGYNIRMPFSTQINTWEYLMAKYPDKFYLVWIMLDQVRHFPKLIKWAKTNGMTIGLVAPDKWTHKGQNNDKIHEALKEVVKYL